MLQILTCMLISNSRPHFPEFIETCFFPSGGGLILSYIVERYHGIAVFNPVVNGMLKQNLFKSGFDSRFSCKL